MPTEPRTDTDPQRYLLSTVRQSQAAVIDTIRTWTTITEQMTRQVDTAVETVDTAVGEGVRRVEDLIQAAQAEQELQDPEQPQAPTAESPQQNRKFDGRTYEERTLEELRERAGEVQLEGRSSMSKDELIAALRQHTK